MWLQLLNHAHLAGDVDLLGTLGKTFATANAAVGLPVGLYGAVVTHQESFAGFAIGTAFVAGSILSKVVGNDVALVDHLVVMGENGGDVQTIGTWHAVLAAGTGNERDAGIADSNVLEHGQLIFGEVLVGGSFPSRYYGLGNCQHVGTIQLPLYMFKEPQQLRLEVALGDIKNEWNFWVYPEVAAEVPSSGEKPEVVVTDTLDDGALSALANGGRVLLSLGRGRVSKALGGEVEVGFSSIFWNTLWTNNGAPHTLGLLCQPDHPSLALFPSDRYSDYQWQDMMTHCDAIRYDLINPGIQPIVRIIDDWFTARPLAMLFEVRVGNGSLLVSGADLITDLDQRPAARQLRRSLEAYMQSNRFHPSTEVSLAEIDKITR